MGFFEIVHPRKIETASPSRLEYRERGGSPRRILGLAAAVLGVAILLGMVKMLSEWAVFNIVVNAVLGAGLIAGGLATLVDLGVILDIDAGTVVRWWGVGFPLRKITRDLKTLDQVETSSRVRTHWRTFPVRLVGSGAPPLELFCPLVHSKAEALAREIAGFLRIPVVLWQPEGELKEAETFLRRWSIHKGMGCVNTSRPASVAYEQRFPTFLRSWGVVALLLGFMALLAPLSGLRFEAQGGGPPPAWLAPCLGAVFSFLGVLFLLGRRGITIEGRSRLMIRWCGILVRLFATQHDLKPFRVVALAREVRTQDAAVFPAYHVLFIRPDGVPLKVFEFAAEDEARARAEELAEFLGLEVRRELEAEGRQQSQGGPQSEDP